MKKLLHPNLACFLLLLLSVQSVSAQLLDTFADANFTANPTWGGATTAWIVTPDSDAAAGATGSNTLRQSSPLSAGTDHLRTQIAKWGTSQEWGFFLGRRTTGYTAANQMYIWLYANEANLTSATVDGYRIAIGDDSGGDELRLEYIVNGALNTTVLTSTASIPNTLVDIGFLVRVTRSASGGWQLFTSTLPNANGVGAVATGVPNATNASVNLGSGTNNTLVPADNGYFGVAALHTSSGTVVATNEIDQIYFIGPTPEIDIRGNSTSIVSGDSSPSSGDFTDFGSNSVSTGTIEKTFVIHNTGSASLTIGSISFSGTGAGDYSVSSLPTTPINGPSGFTSFTVSFNPSVVGVRDAIISIVNNDINENPYTFSVTGTGLADIEEPDFVDLHSPATQTIAQGSSFTVTAQVYEPGLTDSEGPGADIQGWIGYSTSDSSPDGVDWTWIPADYSADADVNDEYSLLFGAGLSPGTYYYASRFQIGTGPFVYGGNFGIWALDSGVLTVTPNVVDFCNVAPTSGSIAQGSNHIVTAQVFELGVTEAAGQGAGIQGWIGYSAADTNPNSGGWTWVAASFNSQSGNNDVYSAPIGASLIPGTYFYASRFQKTGSSEYRYGGTDGFWNLDSGILTVNTPQEINIQGNSATITSGDATPSAADHTDFGSIGLGNTVVRTFTIQNTGGTSLVLNNPAVTLVQTDSFTVTQQPSSPVSPGGSTTFQITFNPTVTGADSNTVRIGSNDADEALYTFAVQGAATIAAPVALDALPVGTTSFTANWNPAAGATSYRLDVSSDSSFQGPYANLVAWNFPNNPDDATADGGIAANAAKTITVAGGPIGPAFANTGATTNSANATNWQSGNLTKYWEVQVTTTGYYSTRISSKQRGSATGPRDFKLQYKIGVGGTYTDVPGATVTVANNYIAGVLSNVALPAACDNQASVYLRWIMTSNMSVGGTADVVTGGVANIDDILVEGRISTMIAPYNDFNVGNVTSYNVNTNITPNTTYYYRVRAVSGGASANSNTIIVTTDPVSVTWAAGAWSNVTGPDADIEAVIEDAYNTGETEGIFTAKKVTINTGGSLTIATGTNLTVVNEVVNTLTETALVVENNANLIQVNNVDNSGNATVNRDSNALMRLDYTLWSSPVEAQNLLGFSPETVETRFYIYNPGTDLYNAYAPSNNFAEGTGYLIRMPNTHPTTPTVWNGVFKGELNNGNVSIPVANNTFNAVGNPYPSTIDADLFIGANNITAPLYFWRKTNNTATTSYATYTLAGGAGTGPNTAGDPNAITPNGIIQVGQGFIVKSTSTALVFNNQMRVGDNNGQFFRTSEVERNRLWLNLTNSAGVFSQTLVSYMTGATQEVDAAIDGLYFNDSQIALTSIINNEEYAVQGRALPFADTDMVPLGFKVTTAGSYTIGLDHVDGLFEDESLDILLKDNTDNSMHNLKQGSYTFASEPGVFNSRFEIVYQTTLGTNDPIEAESQIVVYKQHDEIVIHSGKANISKVKVFDIRGRLLVEQDNVNALETRIFAGTTNEVLIVKIISDDNSETTKKVIN